MALHIQAFSDVSASPGLYVSLPRTEACVLRAETGIKTGMCTLTLKWNFVRRLKLKVWTDSRTSKK